MLRKPLETKSDGIVEGGTDSAPRPGDYDLGSLESRAAARALLDEKLVGDQQKRLRVVIHRIGKPIELEASTCLRYRCADSREPGSDLVTEVVRLNGAHPTETQSEQLEDWICRVPIDGRTYKFAEVGNG